jgi:uncharacterized iron-regulated protein
VIPAIVAALVAAGLTLQVAAVQTETAKGRNQDSTTTATSEMGRRADIVDLAIGDPARKDRTVKAGVDRPIDTRGGNGAGDGAGTEIAASDVAQRLRDTRILLIGESHTSRESHRVQFQVIEALHRAGRRVIIGLEMYPYTAQPALDRWSRGAVGGPAAMSEEAFIKESAWYLHWGLNFGYYRDIFLFARDNGLRMVGLNAPRDVIAAVRKKGLRNLTPEEARQIPADIDAENAEHLTLFKTYFGGGDATHGGTGATGGTSGTSASGTNESVWKDMLGAQAAWDATMAFHAVKAWREAKDERAIVVVLVGSGHVAYGLGIARQARRSFDGEVSSIIPVEIAKRDKGESSEPVQVRASYADIVWGVPAEPYLAYPSLGITPVTRSADQLQQVVVVDRNSPAAQAGVAVGDIVLAIDGQPVTSRETFNRLSVTKDWGDTADLKLRRGTEEITVKLFLRR